MTSGMTSAPAREQTVITGPAWLVPEYQIVAQLPANPDPTSGRPAIYFMASSLIKLPNGTLVAAISQGRRRPQWGAGLEDIVVCNSHDDGATWTKVAELPYDSMEPVLFVRDGRLYQILTPNRPESDNRHHFDRDPEGRIWISYSDDEGVSWSDPALVLKGVPPFTSGGEAALVERDGNLYFTLSNRYEKLAAVCCQMDKGILNPDAWRISELVEMPIPDALVHGTYSDGSTMRCLEGNVVEVGGRLLVIARAVLNRYGTANMGAVFEIHDKGEGPLELEFLQLYPIPGGQCKFYIKYDEQSKLYWMTSNLPSNSQDLINLKNSSLGEAIAKQRTGSFSLREDRRLLTLWYSLDSLNWIPAGWIAKADGWAQSFMYPVFVIDGDDILVLARSARDSGNFHDTDLTTFHRVRNFRNLAVDLIPSKA